MDALRYSVVPGSDNSNILEKRQTWIADYAAVYDIFAGQAFSAEFTTVFMPIGSSDVTFTFSELGGNFIGDRLTVVCEGAGTVSFGLGFVNAGSSPEVPGGATTICGTFEFIYASDENGWALTNFIIF